MFDVGCLMFDVCVMSCERVGEPLAFESMLVLRHGRGELFSQPQGARARFFDPFTAIAVGPAEWLNVANTRRCHTAV